MSKTAIMIPARMASQRLPNKIMHPIFGKPMIQHVFERAQKSGVGDVFVATCSNDVKNLIESLGGCAILTDPNLPSGTDRIAAALETIPTHYDYVINLQGDLPFFPVADLVSLQEEMIRSKSMTTLCAVMDESDIQNPNAVKVVVSFDEDNTHNYDTLSRESAPMSPHVGGEGKSGRALYFSRAPIPHGANTYYHHVGIYGYPLDVLKAFVKHPPSPLEHLERLEQLRALEMGCEIRIRVIDQAPLSCDTQDDLDYIIEHCHRI